MSGDRLRGLGSGVPGDADGNEPRPAVGAGRAYEFHVEAWNGATLLGTSEHRGFWVDDFCLNAVVVADVDGDGRTDRVCSASGQTRVSRATNDGFEEPSVWLAQALTNPFAADFDGDGRTDLGLFDGSTGTFSVALSTGTAFSAPVSWGVAGVSGYSCASGGAATGTGDFDGNGKTDVFCKLPTRDEVLVGLSTGSGFTYSLFGSAVCDTAERVGTMEFDGDGKSDWYCVGVTNGLFRVFRSTGTSFQTGVTAADGSFCGDPYHVLAELNGDGRTDLVCSTNGRVRLSTGRGFGDQGSDFGGWCTATGASVFAADVDGDGVAELVCNQPQAGSEDIQVRKWDGTQLTSAQTWLPSFCPGNVTSGDFNGDGKADLLCDGVEAALGGTPAWRADFMSSAQTSLGGVVSLEYGFSTDFANEPGVGTQVLLTSLTTDDGRGGIATTSYTYSGGAMNREARRFLGYETIRQDLPCIAGETQCPWIETQFRQDLPAVGRPSRVERRAGNAALLAATDYVYTTVDTASLRKALLTEVTAYEFDGSGTACGTWPCANGKRTRTGYTHDAYGNVTQTVAYGDVDASGDEVTTAHTYFAATTPYIVRAVAQSETFAGVGTGGTRLSARRTLYDGSSNWQAVPTAGVVTGTADWLDTEDRYLVTEIARDAYGNPTSQTDPTNRTVSMAYDGDALFPVSTTNAASETTSTSWNALCGVPAQATDEAGQVTAYTYDALCRPTRVDGPAGSFTTWQYVSLGDPTAQRKVTSIPSATDGDGTGDQWSAEYLDGMGRTYKTTAKGPTPAASIVTERGFDARGNLAWAKQPRYDGDTDYTTTFSYDSLDR
ncbi:MAG: VCBS repeat-containing protein, partial [Vicinamibacteria bacterium]|nr:VCBS repeat-containing protein [Vicinamibacteria bacterium]